MTAPYSSNVFINCPFDSKYLNIRNAIIQILLLQAMEGHPKVIGRAVSNRVGYFAIHGLADTPDSVFYVTADLGGGRVLTAVLGGSLPRRATVNELTTVAFSYSMAQFLKNGALAGDDFGLRIAAGMNNNLAAPIEL